MISEHLASKYKCSMIAFAGFDVSILVVRSVLVVNGAFCIDFPFSLALPRHRPSLPRWSDEKNCSEPSTLSSSFVSISHPEIFMVDYVEISKQLVRSWHT
jgi:hypothetical protein